MSFLKHHPIVTAAALLLLLLIGATVNTWLQAQTTQGRSYGGGVVLIDSAPVLQTELVDRIEAIGTAKANESVVLSAKVTDTVRKVNFEDGMLVERGAILVELTDSEETALLAEAQATADEARRQHQRIENLIAQQLASQTNLDAERARMQTAEARLNALIARLDDRLIRAPFSGVLGFRQISEGTLLTPSTAVTTLDDIATIKLDFNVPELYLAALKPGQPLNAMSGAYPGEHFDGLVTTINSRVDPVTRTVLVRAEVNNDDLRLRPGMLLNVSLELARSQALTIPEQAVIPMQNTQFVYVIDADDTAQRREISVGRRRPGLVEVTDGLVENEEVITVGVIKVNQGSKVKRREQETKTS